ncbi:helix-turn-helix transcriptional regulator [Halegenticoccus tardaugens]|uniref:helix-turn-helix transcriptional regulator n=1 Tax=Halegenticoccus tardaugens TaxID=2071624 RepID=UPI00100B67C8|nr:hypothetical protein [Halegenticoccus tardaugens]
MSAREDIAFLVGSSIREEILRELSESNMRPTELAAECSCARETAQRTLAGFVDRGWVTKEDGRYRITPAGDLVLEQYERLASTVTGAHRLRPFLANAGLVAQRLLPDALGCFTVTTATSDNPHAPIDRYLSVLGDEPVSSFRGITPIVSRVFNEATEAVIGPETEMELVIDESVLDASRTDYPDALRRAFELDQFDLFLASETIDFGLALVDGHAYVGAYDEDGNLVASIDGTDETLRELASDLYVEYRSRSNLLEPDRTE